MHELSICQALLRQIDDLITEHHASGVIEVVLGIGPLSGVESHLLANAYSIASAGTVAEQAKLIIEALPVRVNCPQCGTESAVQHNKLLCPHCGNWRTILISGDELLLMSVELAQEAMAKNYTLH